MEMTRRTALSVAALAAVPVVTLVPVPAMAARPSDRRAWDVAMAALDRADREDKAFNAIYDPLAERFADEVAKLPPNEDSWKLAWSRRAVREFDEGRVKVEPYAWDDFEKRLIECREVVARDERRGAQIAAIDQELGYSEVEAKWEALGEARYQAEWALMDTPAPDGPALLFKLDKLLEAGGGGWSDEALAQTVADARRLLS